ncbi:GNAT family N-acetyltransferase [Streptomyces sp. So13.3]|uniref:GNAT family N-acetyltransferase n=1 Tax=Streptomyces TaxID=1883 RepID=UPI001105C371|nr:MULTISPECIES: GNAT family N-acetyltransferase [Streptomyces]MCZ4102044.1 GNAT family N-acetyltransferase [Streptomyces sp. H39-C1]QNA75910.1 GNAT family N-acetyltransferase [Streptomyces sp. So13.3]
MSDLVIRPLVAGEAHLFASLADPGLVGRAILGDPYSMVGDGGDYRPEWTWVALRDGVVVARAAWWAGADDEKPKALDWFDFAEGEADAGVWLLRTAPLYGEYDLLLPPGWRERPELLAAAQSRIDAVTAAGLKQLVERYRYTWTAGDPLPARTGRLEYRPEPDDAVILDVVRRIQQDTLDAHDREEIDKTGGEAAAGAFLGWLNWLPSPRDWWRLAFTPEGELAGLHIPAHNPAGPTIGFIGVVPEQRGHGYAYDLLVECTQDLVEQGADRITAATDQGNFPMAANFAKAGYPVSQERINFI